VALNVQNWRARRFVENLHDSRRRSLGGFADEEMDMLRHDDVSNQCKTVEVAHFSQNMDEEIPWANRAE
jgi:hypothetical protein